MSVAYPALPGVPQSPVSPMEVDDPEPENSASTGSNKRPLSPPEEAASSNAPKTNTPAASVIAQRPKKRKKKPHLKKPAEEGLSPQVVSKPPAPTVTDEADELRRELLTPEQLESVEKVLRTSAKNPYKILNVPDPSEKKVILKSYKHLALLLHPDKNNHPNAEEAFKKINSAAKTLGVEGENFNENAYGSESESESDDDGDLKMPDAHPKPEEYHHVIYRQATPYIDRLFNHPDDSEARKALDDLNNKLYLQNTKDGLSQNNALSYYRIPHDTIIANVAEIKRIGSKMAEIVPAKNPKQFKRLNMELDRCNDFIETLIQRQQLPESWGKIFYFNHDSAKVEFTDRAVKKNSGVDTGSTSESQSEVESEEEHGSTPAVNFKKFQSGYTREGEKILGYRSTKNRSGNIRNEQFVIQIGGKNGRICELRSRVDVGNRAADAYLSLPTISTIEKQSKFDSDMIAFIQKYHFVACSHGDGGYDLPPLVAYVKYGQRSRNGTITLRKDWLWRTTLRSVMGRKDADLDIEEVFDEEEYRTPWDNSKQTRARGRIHERHDSGTRNRIPRHRPRIAASDTSEYESTDEEETYSGHSKNHRSTRFALKEFPEKDDDINIQISEMINKILEAKLEKVQRPSLSHVYA